MKLILLLAVLAIATLVAARRAGVGEVLSPAALDDGNTPASGRSRAERLLADLDLRERETGFLGTWRECEIDGTRVAFQAGDARLGIWVGSFDPDQEQIAEVYLGRVCATQPLPPDGSEQRLDPHVGTEGRALARNYFLWTTGSAEYPALEIPAVREGLLALSPTVVEVQLLECGAIQLEIDAQRASVESLRSDVQHAIAAASALADSPIGAL